MCFVQFPHQPWPMPAQPTWQWNGPLQKVSGWQCPGCGKCYAPIVRECDTCGKGAQKEGA